MIGLGIVLLGGAWLHYLGLGWWLGMGLGLAFGLFLGAAIGVSRALNREPKTVILSDAKDLCNLPAAPRCPRLQRSFGQQKARARMTSIKFDS
jgi:hypothetical protein